MKIKNPFRRVTLEEGNAVIAAHAETAHLHHSLEATRLRYEAARMIAQAAAHEIQANACIQQVEKHRNKAG